VLAPPLSGRSIPRASCEQDGRVAPRQARKRDRGRQRDQRTHPIRQRQPHCRTGTCGITASQSHAAVSTMRAAPHDGPCRALATEPLPRAVSHHRRAEHERSDERAHATVHSARRMPDPRWTERRAGVRPERVRGARDLRQQHPVARSPAPALDSRSVPGRGDRGTRPPSQGTRRAPEKAQDGADDGRTRPSHDTAGRIGRGPPLAHTVGARVRDPGAEADALHRQLQSDQQGHGWHRDLPAIRREQDVGGADEHAGHPGNSIAVGLPPTIRPGPFLVAGMPNVWPSTGRPLW
jgi:hypothetical protein